MYEPDRELIEKHSCNGTLDVVAKWIAWIDIKIFENLLEDSLKSNQIDGKFVDLTCS